MQHGKPLRPDKPDAPAKGLILLRSRVKLVAYEPHLTRSAPAGGFRMRSGETRLSELPRELPRWRPRMIEDVSKKRVQHRDEKKGTRVASPFFFGPPPAPAR